MYCKYPSKKTIHFLMIHGYSINFKLIDSPPDPPTSPSTSSDRSAMAQTPPAGKTLAPHQTTHEPTSREYRWYPPPKSPAARHPISAPDQRPDHATARRPSTTAGIGSSILRRKRPEAAFVATALEANE